MIKILILDDAEEKISKLREVIVGLLPEDQINIDCSKNIADGRAKLQTSFYDLLLLDMVLPEREGGDLQPDGGALFLEEIHGNPSIKKPLQIIGLTEFEQQFTDAQKEFKDRLWYLLFYSCHSNEWKRQLKNKVLLWAEKRKVQKGMRTTRCFRI